MSMDTHKRVVYCPMHQKMPQRPKNQNPLNLTIPISKTCPSCQAMKKAAIAKIKVAGKVRVCAPGESGRDKKDQKESLFNPHRLKKLKANRAKTQPP